MKKSKLFLVPLLGLLTLASCGGGGTSDNPYNLPDTDQEVVDAVAGIGAICTNSGAHMFEGEDENNNVDGGSAVLVATTYLQEAWSGTEVIDIPVSIAWNLDEATADSWTITTMNDGSHLSLVPTAPSYDAEDDLHSTLTGTISWGSATANVVYKITVPRTAAPVVYKSTEDVFNDFFVDGTLRDGTTITAYGYVTAYTENYSNVFIQSGTHAIQLYGAGSFSSFFTEGALVAVTGDITNYYGLELENVTSVVSYDGDDVPAATVTTLTADIIRSISSSGTMYDNTLATVDAQYVGVSAVASGTYEFTIDGASIYLYLRSSCTSESLAEANAVLASATPGNTYRLSGILTWYGNSQTLDIIPYLPGGIVAL